MKTKRLYIFIIALVSTIIANAQITIDSLGKVVVGARESTLSIMPSEDSINAVKVSSRKRYALNLYHLQPIGNRDQQVTALNVKQIGTYAQAKNYGIDVQVSSGGPKSKNNVGVSGRAAMGTNTNIGVLGSVYMSPDSNAVNYIGVFGTTQPASTFNLAYPGRYAGYFDGALLATGGIYGSFFSLAGPKSQTGVQSLARFSEEDESISDKLLSVQTTQFIHEEDVLQYASAESHMPTSSSEDIDIADMGDDAIDEFFEKQERERAIVCKKAVKHYGLDGAQLKAVFPELVDEDSQGNYRINYSEMVPLLLQSIRELSARVEELEGKKSGGVQKLNAKATSIESEGESTDIVRMSQNKPNPFSESSVITLCVPEDTKQAAIYVYDLSGKLVKSIPVDKRGETDITLYASDLQEGMFVYSLVTDGTVAATRRMMVVKN